MRLFHSATGLSSEPYPDDLNRHGQLIIETKQNDTYDICPPEGTHFYSFVLHKSGLFGLTEKVSVLRFSETVPSGKVALGRIQDRMELQRLIRQHELGPLEHESKLGEAKLRLLETRKRLDGMSTVAKGTTQEIISEQVAAIDAILETYIAKREKLEALSSDPRFKKLDPTEQDAVMGAIKRRLDPAEISARRDMRGKK